MSAESSNVTSARRANLKKLLSPRQIVFIGGDRAGAAIGACRLAGYAGEMLAIHPKKKEIAGIPCFARVGDLPMVPDAAFISVPAPATVSIVRDLAQAGAAGAVCYASGFAEIGAAGAENNQALIAAAGDMAIVGPNCFGIINYVNHGSLWSVPYPAGTAARGAAIIGQSGNLCINLSMNQREVPFSYIISAGNQAVLGFEDYVDVLVDDPKVTAIGLFLEGIRDIVAFSASCRRALERKIPIVALRSGVSEMGARVAASHTSSLAGQNELYDTLFQRLGILTTQSVPQFLELLKALSVSPLPRGRRLTVFSSSGGDNGMSADFASLAGLELPPPSEAQAAAVNALLPDFGAAGNPLDFTAGYWGQENLLTPMFTTMLEGDYDIGAIVIDHPRQSEEDPVDGLMAAMVRSIGTAARKTGKIGAVASVNPESMPRKMRQMVLAEGLIPLQGIHDSFIVLGRVADYAATLARVSREGLPTTPLPASPCGPGRRHLDEAESKRRLAEFGLAVPAGRVASLGELANLAASMPGPYALKALSADLPHKTEAGGVALNLADAAAVLAAAERIQRDVAAHRPGLVVDRFLLEPMAQGGVAEILAGVTVDPHFGPVLVIGAGGILVELLRDAQRLLLPTTAGEIEAALRRLKTFPLLDGFRGRPKADLPALVSAIAAVAEFTAANANEIAEIDVNPIIVRAAGAGVVAVDALIVTAE
ncbi:MAG: acetate--CoA ligase family protein [Rhodospirillaceae bacterium]|nr:acetate--CoA ligase family protein [Rhodospirillaceae bacterium]